MFTFSSPVFQKEDSAVRPYSDRTLRTTSFMASLLPVTKVTCAQLDIMLRYRNTSSCRCTSACFIPCKSKVVFTFLFFILHHGTK
jgi:hypothetical protein